MYYILVYYSVIVHIHMYVLGQLLRKKNGRDIYVPTVSYVLFGKKTRGRGSHNIDTTTGIRIAARGSKIEMGQEWVKI